MIRTEGDAGGALEVFWSGTRTRQGHPGVPIGTFYKEVDGYYHWVMPESHGAWAAGVLREIANKLDELNKPWDDVVRADLGEQWSDLTDPPS